MKAVSTQQVFMYQWKCPACGVLNHEHEPHGNYKHLASCRACPEVVHIKRSHFQNGAIMESAANYEFAREAIQ